MSSLVITGRDIRRVMRPVDYLEAVEEAFRAAVNGRAYAPPPMHLPMHRGAFHAKGASISLDRDYVALKINGNFPGNPEELGLPTIQGAILLSDGATGALLAIIDSIEVTLRRTAAASALAARLLGRPNSRTLLICGCGEQGRAHVDAFREVFPIESIIFWDRDASRAERMAEELGGKAVRHLPSQADSADVIVTCTSATNPFLDLETVRPGTFVAAVGADSPGKSEIDPRLLAAAKVVTDMTAQCAEMGDLHHAIEAGTMSAADVRAELGKVIIGEEVGRTSPDEIIILDSTGTGLQDVAASAAIYERCAGDPAVMSVALSA